MHIHIHHHWDGSIQADLAIIKQRLDQLLQKDAQIMAAIDDIQADVTAEDTVIASVETLLQSLSAQLAAAGVDPAKLAALRADIQSHTSAMAAAVVANTPAAPAP